MANRIQLNLEVPHRHTLGKSQPPKANTRRAYICELYKTFGWSIPAQWQQQTHSPAPEFSESDAVVGDEPAPKKKKVKRIKVL